MRSLLATICLAIVWALLAFASPDNGMKGKPRIVGGNAAAAGMFSYAVYIRATSAKYNQTMQCTGNLIAPNIVLTAAHCTLIDRFHSYLPKDIQVAAGNSMPANKVLANGIRVSEFVRHPGYTDSVFPFNDIAILFLEENIPSEAATPIKIYYGGLSLGTTLTSVGFGKTLTPVDNSATRSLRYVDLSIVDPYTCAKYVQAFFPQRQVCANAPSGKSACHGDSGGPLVVRVNNGKDVALVGITSFGPALENDPYNTDCGRVGFPGYYARPSYYLEWIAQTANLNVDDILIENSTDSRATSSLPKSTKAATTRPTDYTYVTTDNPMTETADVTILASQDASSASPAAKSARSAALPMRQQMSYMAMLGSLLVLAVSA
ncbi:hypothetical protein GGI12_002674 [Dipsacomyces acuminosporus]|nr:hypothetical protein GGI12_002674 [Dipsacomyces acuminosporus]